MARPRPIRKVVHPIAAAGLHSTLPIWPDIETVRSGRRGRAIPKTPFGANVRVADHRELTGHKRVYQE